MTAVYPGGVKNFGSSRVDGDYIPSSDINELREEVVALEAVISAKGDLMSRSSAAVCRVAVGSDGALLAADSTAAAGLGWKSNQYRLLRIMNVFSGTTVYTPTAGTRAVYVECIGGGGAGGGAAVSSANLSLGGGGGAGAYSAKWLTGSIKSSYTVSVGAGGTGVSGAAGNAGGSTTFDSPSICTAAGGSGGGTLAAGTAVNTQGGGAGGLSSSGVGDLKLDSADGGWGLRLSASIGRAGSGGGAPIGGGLTGAPAATAAGIAGGNYGGGGSGAITTAAVQTGGAGASGVIRIWEFA